MLGLRADVTTHLARHNKRIKLVVNLNCSNRLKKEQKNKPSLRISRAFKFNCLREIFT
jgi:hypothetical protein